jgi:hypothetical protein
LAFDPGLPSIIMSRLNSLAITRTLHLGWHRTSSFPRAWVFGCFDIAQ